MPAFENPFDPTVVARGGRCARGGATRGGAIARGPRCITIRSTIGSATNLVDFLVERSMLYRIDTLREAHNPPQPPLGLDPEPPASADSRPPARRAPMVKLKP